MEPFQLLLNREGPNFKVVIAADGSQTRTELAAGPIDLVAAGPLEDGTEYQVENLGMGRAEIWPSAAAPSIAARRGNPLLPKGIMALATVEPVEGGPVWVWAAESMSSLLAVSEV